MKLGRPGVAYKGSGGGVQRGMRKIKSGVLEARELWYCLSSTVKY